MVLYKNSKIYKIISSGTNKIYIGFTTQRLLSKRLVQHRKEYFYKKHYPADEILKCGDYKIILIELYPCNSKDELNSRYQYWIDFYKDTCVNIPREQYHIMDLGNKFRIKYNVNNGTYDCKEVSYTKKSKDKGFIKINNFRNELLKNIQT